MKKEANRVTTADSIRIPGERQFSDPSKKCRFQKPVEVIRRSLTVVFVFEPTETGHPEQVVLAITDTVFVHRGSNR